MNLDQNFACLIRSWRRQLDMTREEVGRRIGTSTAYIAHLEADRRHPSEKVVVRLAEVLGLDRRELSLPGKPANEKPDSPRPDQDTASVWEAFAKDKKLQRSHKISGEEMETLSKVALMGEVNSSRDFIFVLQAIGAYWANNFGIFLRADSGHLRHGGR